MTAHRYGILLLPAANRVYADASRQLLAGELGVMSRTVLDGRVSDVGERTLGGVPYLTFTLPELTARDRDFLANLSSLYALFRLHDDGRLAPVELRRLDRFDDDLLTIQKYAGKTNEHFTKLLLNVTVLASASATAMPDRPLRVLDPLCGRGTTLNQALMYGWDAAGVDLDGRDFEAYGTFLRTWLKRKRLKHTVESTRVRRDRKVLGRKLQVAVGASKERWKAGEKHDLTVVHADTVRATDFFRPRSFDVLVTDAPYGVQHGSRGPDRTLTRSPVGLLRSALPGWLTLLRPGGAVGISWNARVAPREELVELLAAHHLQVCDDGPFREFQHRVDQAVLRDVVVARKPAT